MRVEHVEADGHGGWFVHFHNPSTLDGKPMDGYFHITESVLADFGEEFDPLRLELMKPNPKPADIGARWLTGYTQRLRHRRRRSSRRSPIGEFAERRRAVRNRR